MQIMKVCLKAMGEVLQHEPRSVESGSGYCFDSVTEKICVLREPGMARGGQHA